MACEHARQIGPYLDGELPPGQARALEAHLAVCSECAGEAREVRDLRGLFAMAEFSPLSRSAMARLHRHVETLVGPDPGVLRIARVLSGIAACLLVAGGLWLSQERRPTQGQPNVTVSLAAWEEAALERAALRVEPRPAPPSGADVTMPEWVLSDLSPAAGEDGGGEANAAGGANGSVEGDASGK